MEASLLAFLDKIYFTFFLKIGKYIVQCFFKAGVFGSFIVKPDVGGIKRSAIIV